MVIILKNNFSRQNSVCILSLRLPEGRKLSPHTTKCCKQHVSRTDDTVHILTDNLATKLYKEELL